MAATCSLALYFIISLSTKLLLLDGLSCSIYQSRATGSVSDDFSVFLAAYYITGQVRREQSAWTKFDCICLSPPDFEPINDITMYMDVSTNPGPKDSDIVTTQKPCQELNVTPPSRRLTIKCHRYTRNLYCLRHHLKSAVQSRIPEDLKSSGPFRYRGKHGKGFKINQTAIPTLVTKCRVGKQSSVHRGRNYNNLITIKCIPVRESNSSLTIVDNFAVPKCMILNIRSVLKPRRGVKENVALEADKFVNNIDICVVSETHVKKIVPDSVVGISNYVLYRRDRS